MLTRVTQQTMAAGAARNLQASLAQVARLQEQASTQKAFLSPSEDPRAAGEAMAVRKEQRALDQFARNVGDARGWVTTIDTALTSTTGVLQKVRDLTVQGGNTGALSPEAREAIAVQIDGLRDELLGAANSQYLGRFVFAGDSDAAAAVDEDYGFTGSGSAPVERRLGTSSTVRVDADGAAVFGEGEDSAFALLERISADLRSGTPVTARLEDIDDALSSVLSTQAAFGARYNEIERAESVLEERAITVETSRAAVEDVELAKVLLDLSVQSTNYQAALNVTARVLQPSLLDYLA